MSKTITKRKLPPKKRKRKTRSHYKRGFHSSKKCTNSPIRYRSRWEYIVCLYLDQDPNVIEYQYEPYSIRYKSNISTGKFRSYTPDFLINYQDGSVYLIEVKRKSHLNHKKVLKKAKHAEVHAQKNGMIYEFWTDDHIKNMRKFLSGSL